MHGSMGEIENHKLFLWPGVGLAVKCGSLGFNINMKMGGRGLGWVVLLRQRGKSTLCIEEFIQALTDQ